MLKKKCKYYPCHKDIEDCIFCYCPIYPCYNTNLGKMYKKVWDCSDCTLFHKKEVVKKILKMKGTK
jgi:Zn-finger protein